MAGLAAFVEDGVFTPDGVDRAVNVLKSHMKRVRYFGCKRVDVFATAVLRNAVNRTEAVAEIERRCGLAVTLLSARDEAHLGFVGARCSTPLERGTLVDIGGGSTELTRVDGGRDSDDVSLGQGSLSSFARFVRNILPVPIEMDAIACEFRGNLRKLPSLEPYKAPTLYGVGGSTRAAAKLIQQLEGHLRAQLLNRTTRRVTVTMDGAAYYERALRVLGEIDELDLEGTEVLHPEYGTKPHVYYTGLPKRFIAGTVFTPEDEEIVEGATVTITNGTDTYTDTTNSWGDFWIDELAEDEWTVTIEGAGKGKTLTVSTVEKDRGLGDIALV